MAGSAKHLRGTRHGAEAAKERDLFAEMSLVSKKSAVKAHRLARNMTQEEARRLAIRYAKRHRLMTKPQADLASFVIKQIRQLDQNEVREAVARLSKKETVGLLLEANAPSVFTPSETVTPASKESALGLEAYRRALARAKARGAERATSILQQQEMLTKDEVQKMLKRDWEGIRKLIDDRKILALSCDARNESLRFPAWQLDKRKHAVREGVKELFEELYDDPWSVYRFLVMPCSELNGAVPKDVMWQQQDGVKIVKEIAQNIGRH